MGATAWTEESVTATGFQDAVPAVGFDPATDFFADVLFEGTPFFAPMPPTYTEMSVAATAQTELTVAATAWTELT